MWFVRRFLSSVVHRSQYTGQSGLFRRPQHCPPSELELRYLQCTCCWRSRVPVAGFETLESSFISTSAPCTQESGPLDACYTAEQRQLILQLLNTASQSELSVVKLLRNHVSRNIVEYRDKNGPFNTLESVVNVPRLKHKRAVTVFNFILNPVKREKKVKVNLKLAKFIKPEIDKSWLEHAGSIVSVVCGINKIAWTHVDCSMTLLAWEQKECPHFLKGTYMATAYLQDVSEVVACLPSADFYIIEKTSLSHQNTSLFSIMVHLRTVEAMLFALLEPRNTKTPNTPPRVLNMMRTAVGQHFGLMVGESRVSGADVVKRLMTESVTHRSPRLSLPQELLLKYRNSFQMGSNNGGEELCSALLQAVAFYELLRKCSE